MRNFFTRNLAVLALIGTSLAPVPVAVAQEDDGTSNARQTATTEEVDDIEAAMEQVNTKPAKPSRLSKEKWSKINYSRVYKRRQNNGLPAEIRLAPQAVRSRDPALQVADITSTVPQPEAESVLLTYIDSFSGNIPTSMPDISILFNDADVANAKAVSTGQIVFQAGILDDVKYIDQAAFLLGHELAHIAYDHFKNEENRRTLNTVVTTATLIAEGGDSQRASNSDAFVSYLVFSEFLLGPQWSRSNETAADELGIDLLVSSGMSLEGARSMFRALAADEAERARLLEERCGGKPGLPATSFFEQTRTLCLICSERPEHRARAFKAHPGRHQQVDTQLVRRRLIRSRPLRAEQKFGKDKIADEGIAVRRALRVSTFGDEGRSGHDRIQCATVLFILEMIVSDVGQFVTQEERRLIDVLHVIENAGLKHDLTGRDGLGIRYIGIVEEDADIWHRCRDVAGK